MDFVLIAGSTMRALIDHTPWRGVGMRIRRRIERFGRILLLANGGIVALLFLGAWATGRSDLPLINLYLLIPLLGGLFGLVRVAPACLAKPDRSTVVYLLFCLGLLAWGLSGAWYGYQSLLRPGAAIFPSIGDIGYYVGGIAWVAATWVLYESVVDDFLSEVEASSYLISLMAVATLFVLSVAGGADLIAAVKAGGNTLQIVALTFPLLYGFTAVMMFRLARGARGAKLAAGQRPLKIIAGGLGLIYLAQMTLETMFTLSERSTGALPAFRNAEPPYVLYSLAFLVLSFGVLNYPLVMPTDADRTKRPRAAKSNIRP